MKSLNFYNNMRYKGESKGYFTTEECNNQNKKTQCLISIVKWKGEWTESVTLKIEL